jgi:thioredoxin 1
MKAERSVGLFLGALLFVMTAGIVLSQSKGTHVEPPGSAREPKPRVTFVELGSVTCIPCKKMQPVMKAVERAYGDQVKVVFHDVWSDDGKPFAGRFNIRLIPTQVFLDSLGKEFFRHEGFFPEEEIHKLFQRRGVTRLNGE